MPDATDRESTWNRLRHRKVVQWGVAYAAGAWGLLQALQFLAETYEWSSRVLKASTLAFLIGLPIVLVLAWYHGDKGERRVTRTELAIITLLFLFGGALFWRYNRASDEPTTAVATPTATHSIPTVAPAAPPHQKSIAVLPFADMSPDKSQEYMADGMAEELLNLLGQAPDLKVIARTSSFAFKGKDVDIAEIAKKLNVAHVLEGSVRTSGNKIRVTAQLIRTADSTHLWSQTYDRPLEDVFAVQDEIAGAIAQALQIRLMGGTLDRSRGGTSNLEAYQLYLRARNGEDWHTESSLDAVEKFLERAIELDPEFSLAWSMLASVVRTSVEYGYVDTRTGAERERALTLHALQLAPDSAAAHAALGDIYLAYDWDWTAAERESRRALTLDSTSPRVLNSAGRLSAALGRWDDAIRQFRAALSRDPVHESVMFNLALTYYRARRFAEAEGTFKKLLEMSPGFPWTRGAYGEVLMWQGKPEEAIAIVQHDADDSMRLVSLPVVLWSAGRHAEAEVALRQQIVHWADTGAYFIAQSYAYKGNNAAAIDWLERAYQQRDPALIEMYGNPLLDGLSSDPRFKAFLRKMNLPDWPPPKVP